MAEQQDAIFDAIVIGSGFGGAVAITHLSDHLPDGARILVLERGTWWRNPEGPGLRKSPLKEDGTAPSKHELEIKGKWQYWGRPNDSSGLAYFARSVFKESLFDNDQSLPFRTNRKGMYRFTRFSHANGNVDVVSGSAVGGGSLFYSGVNLIPHQPVLNRIGLDYLTSTDFQNAGDWMKDKRGNINKINTKVPVPEKIPSPPTGEDFQLTAIPESGDPGVTADWEMPNPKWTPEEQLEGEYTLLDRARVLKRAMNRVVDDGGFGDSINPGKVWKRTTDPHDDGFEPLPLSVVEFDPRDGTDSTKKHTYCTRDGRCLLGCLPSARHTIYKTILKQNEGEGNITVYPLTKVSHISKVQDTNGAWQYVVHFESDDPTIPHTEVRGGKVFLGAGCLGTTEIMLRSKAQFEKTGGREGLALSPTVGTRFSTNGDFGAFTWNIPRDFKTSKKVPDKDRIGNPNPTVGPINSSHFYVTFGDGDDRVDINVEDAGIPEVFAHLVYELLPDPTNMLRLIAKLAPVALDLDPFAIKSRPRPEDREQADFLTEHELVSNVFFYNMMGSAANEPLGTFALSGNGLKLSYPDDKPLHEWSVFKRQLTILDQLTAKMYDPGDQEESGAVRRPKLTLLPTWTTDKRVTVVHPLGGCPIGLDADQGVVDRDGRVFDPSGGGNTTVHENLFVVDASAIPGALAVNPTFTIVTHAVRCLEKAVPAT